MRMLFVVMALTVLTSNVNGIHDSRNWADVWRELPKHDVICLQEMHLCSVQEFAFKLYAQSYDFFFSHGTTASAGVCLAICQSKCVNAVKSAEMSGRLVGMDVTLVDGSVCQILTIYALVSPSKRAVFFSLLEKFFTDNMILVGDFNSVTNSQDCLSGKLDSTSVQLLMLLENRALEEPNGPHISCFTYHHLSVSNCKSHLDRIYSNISPG